MVDKRVPSKIYILEMRILSILLDSPKRSARVSVLSHRITIELDDVVHALKETEFILFII